MALLIRSQKLYVFLLAPALTARQAPSGSPPDVSSRLLGVCNVVDACEGLSIEAVIEAARKLMHPAPQVNTGCCPTAVKISVSITELSSVTA